MPANCSGSQRNGVAIISLSALKAEIAMKYMGKPKSTATKMAVLSRIKVLIRRRKRASKAALLS